MDMVGCVKPNLLVKKPEAQSEAYRELKHSESRLAILIAALIRRKCTFNSVSHADGSCKQSKNIEFSLLKLPYEQLHHMKLL